ncbi:MAG: hypothetical protein IID40_03455 [Planctomycetes bacterium]|nr:hypothetical protein [Planctomycetota bacterium]
MPDVRTQPGLRTEFHRVLGICGLLVVTGCGVRVTTPESKSVPSEPMKVYRGKIQASFPPGSGEVGLSDDTGAMRIVIGSSSRGEPRLDYYEGILPGFSGEGATSAVIGFADEVSLFTVVTPEDDTLVLNALLPDLAVYRDDSGTGFVVEFSAG